MSNTNLKWTNLIESSSINNIKNKNKISLLKKQVIWAVFSILIGTSNMSFADNQDQYKNWPVNKWNIKWSVLLYMLQKYKLNLPKTLKHQTQQLEEEKNNKIISTYKVEKNDTFYGIALKHWITPNEIIKLNPQIKNFNKINIWDNITVIDIKSINLPSNSIKNDKTFTLTNQELTAEPSNIIKKKVEKTNNSITSKYTIKRNDTLYGIAKKYWMTKKEIKKLNPQIKKINKIQVWDIINIINHEKNAIVINNSQTYNREKAKIKEKKFELSDISEKIWKSTFEITEDISTYNIDDLIPDIDVRLIKIETDWKEQLLIREKHDTIFVDAKKDIKKIKNEDWTHHFSYPEKRITKVIKIWVWTKISTYTDDELKFKPYKKTAIDQYYALTSNIRFELYWKKDIDWNTEFNFPNKKVETEAKLEEIIPSNAEYIVLKNWNTKKDSLLIKDEISWKLKFQNKFVEWEIFVSNWDSINILSKNEFDWIIETENQIKEKAWEVSDIISDNYDNINKRYKWKNMCGTNVRWAIEKLFWIDIDNTNMHWFAYEKKMDELALQWIVKKVFIWKPQNADKWAILVYGKWFWKIDSDRYKYWHVEIVLKDWYFHSNNLQTTPWWSARYNISKSKFTWYAYYPILKNDIDFSNTNDFFVNTKLASANSKINQKPNILEDTINDKRSKIEQLLANNSNNWDLIKKHEDDISWLSKIFTFFSNTLTGDNSTKW